MSSSERPLPLVEATAAFMLIMLYIWRLRYEWPSSWLLILGLILASHIFRKETLEALGFRGANLRRCFALYSPFLFFLSAALLAMGMVFHSIRQVTWDSAFASLIFNCVWGLFQQYLLNGYFVNRFRLSFPAGEAKHIPLAAATIFAGVHLPNWFLMAVTFAAGYLSGRVYLRYGNLYFLGVAHGVIGFLLYLVVPDSISHHLYVGPKWFSR